MNNTQIRSSVRYVPRESWTGYQWRRLKKAGFVELLLIVGVLALVLWLGPILAGVNR